MITESVRYKDELLNFARDLERWHSANRWSEKRIHEFERRLLTSFFIVRRLGESGLLSDEIRNHPIPIWLYPPSGKRVTFMNRHRVDELYRLDRGRQGSRRLVFVANQVIHSYVLAHWLVEDRTSTTVLFTSDRARAKGAYGLSTDDVIPLLRAVGSDFPASGGARWDEKLGDYRVTNSNGAPPPRYSRW